MRIREYGAEQLPRSVLVNAGATGLTGITTNVFPSMTLGCGDGGKHGQRQHQPAELINIKRILMRCESRRRPLKYRQPGQLDPTWIGTAAAAVERYPVSRGVSAE